MTDHKVYWGNTAEMNSKPLPEDGSGKLFSKALESRMVEMNAEFMKRYFADDALKTRPYATAGGEVKVARDLPFLPEGAVVPEAWVNPLPSKNLTPLEAELLAALKNVLCVIGTCTADEPIDEASAIIERIEKGEG